MPPDVPEPPRRSHGGSGLPRWLEWTTAIAALVISICSIGIAIYNARIESRLLTANSYPYLISGVSDATPEGADRISLELINNGVGPADERSLRIKLGNRYVTNVQDFVRTAMGSDWSSDASKQLLDLHDNEPTRFIAAKDRGMIFRIDRTRRNARYWTLLDRGMSTKCVSVEFCYCSVFEECWAVTGSTRARVKACTRDPHLEFTPKPRYASADNR